MKKFLLLLIMLFVSNSVFAFSFTGTNPGAVNMAKYYQGNRYNAARMQRRSIPYVYSEQQAKYYGINVANPNTQYRNYGLYQQNYSNNNYSQRYGY